MKILFNCLVYKDQDVVEDLILNIKKFVIDPVIVIHVSPEFKNFDSDRFSRINSVYINSDSYDHGQWGTKIKALTSNHDLIKSKGIEFEYEIIFYPKMLFIKSGIEKYLEGSDLCMPSPTEQKRNEMEYALATKWDVFTKEQKDFFNNDIEKFLVEGMCFSKEVANKMYEMIKCTQLYNIEGHCLEEFVLPTVAKYFSSTIKDYPGIIGYGDISISDLRMILCKEVSEFNSFFTDSQSVDNIYVVHKVDYGYDNEIRKMIRGIR
jgi:hypothetical protein